MNLKIQAFLLPALGVLFYIFFLQIFYPQSFNDVYHEFNAAGNISPSVLWFYYFKLPSFLHFDTSIHPLYPLPVFILKHLPLTLGFFLLNAVNIFLLGLLLFRTQSWGLLCITALAGFESGFTFFSLMLFAMFLQVKTKSVYKLLPLYISTMLLSLPGALLLLFDALIEAVQFRRWPKLATAVLTMGSVLAFAEVVFFKAGFTFWLISGPTMFYNRILAQMKPLTVYFASLPIEHWVLLGLGIFLLVSLLWAREPSDLKNKTVSWPYFLLPLVLALGSNLFLLAVFPVKKLHSTSSRWVNFAAVLTVIAMAATMWFRPPPPVFVGELPPAVVVGVDGLNGQDDLLFIRGYYQTRIYTVDVKVVPLSYQLAQQGLSGEQGEQQYLFPLRVRNFFNIESVYANNALALFQNEPSRAVVVSGLQPLHEERPFTRARILLEKKPDTELFVFNHY